MEQNFTIKNITKNSTNLEVDWSDGKKSKFNYLWLRDNCPTAHDKDSRHRICLLYTSPSPRDATLSRMPSSA